MLCIAMWFNNKKKNSSSSSSNNYAITDSKLCYWCSMLPMYIMKRQAVWRHPANTWEIYNHCLQHGTRVNMLGLYEFSGNGKLGELCFKLPKVYYGGLS